MNDNQVEKEILAKGMTAPRITPADIEANIAKEYYFTAGQGVLGEHIWGREAVEFDLETWGQRHPSDLLTFCVLELCNGFTVTGESACASPENFDAELGRKIARNNAIGKIWPLMGYALKCRLASEAVMPFVKPSIEAIAAICHEVNRAYCESLGDVTQPSWVDAPEWQKDSAMLGVKLHTENPEASASASHESWMAQKVADGWVYGEIKRPDIKQHHCIVPFDQLPIEQQAKDFIFRAVVHALNEGFYFQR